MPEAKKRRKRRSTFATALAQAKSRLQCAEKEKDAAERLLASLSVEIPVLRGVVMALERQQNPGCSSPVERSPNRGRVDGSTPSPGAIPANISTLLPPEDFSGIGSIPALTEDELLPEPDGKELVPE